MTTFRRRVRADSARRSRRPTRFLPLFGRSSERGQVLVIVAAGLVVIIALVGLVIDGGYAWGQQRRTQNGTDAIALAGATTIAPTLKGGTETDGDVGCAVAQAAAANGISNPVAYYTDWQGNLLVPNVQVGACNPGGGSVLPPGAQGVKATGDRQFPTFLARVIGINSFTSSATATAVTGVSTDVCPASSGCAVLPVTFPLTAVTCDGTNRQLQIGTDWPIVQVTDPSNTATYANGSNESIIPLCTTGPGAVGWLDLGGSCGNLSQEITTPCNVSVPIPTWLQTQSGNTNSLDTALNSYTGPQIGVPDDSVVLVPINNNTCMTNPDVDGLPPDPNADDPNCPGDGDSSLNGSGNGNNFYYHVLKVAYFMIDQAYTGGTNPPECSQYPGNPPSGGNGATGCIKGWFLDYATTGVVGPGASGPQDPGPIAIQLIR